MHLVTSLTFHSNIRVFGPYGSEKGTFFSASPSMGKIVGFYGRFSGYLDCVGAYLHQSNTVGPYDVEVKMENHCMMDYVLAAGLSFLLKSH